jgi:ketosteroid isomerase-like protein
MKTHILLAFVGLATGFILPAFGQQKGTIDPRIEQQIRVLAANHDAAINKHDPAAVAALYAQDAVRVTALNNGTFYGRQAIEKAFAKYDFERWQVHNYFIKIDRLTADGNEVRSTGSWSSNFFREGDRIEV